MSGSITIPTLEGRLVRLETLSRSHAADLAIAAEEDRSSYGFTWVPRGNEIGRFLDSHFQRAESRAFVPFAQIRLSDERAVGCTAYWDFMARSDRLVCSRDWIHVALGVSTRHRDQP